MDYQTRLPTFFAQLFFLLYFGHSQGTAGDPLSIE